MRELLINTEHYLLPETLAEITLGQRIAFYQEHGQVLEEMLQSIQQMEGEDSDLEMAEWQLENILRTFSFFTGISRDVLEQSEFLPAVSEVYFTILHPLFNDTITEPQTTFEWQGETWVLPAATLGQHSHASFGEFIDAKQTMQDIASLKQGRIAALLPLCAIFLRKQGEAYDESFLYENSERLTLLEDLPMDIALQVGFFLSSSQRSSPNTLPFFGPHKSERVTAVSAPNTLSGTDGSTSSSPLPKQKCSTYRGCSAIPFSVHV